jgi:hypothetical protein
VAQTAKTVAIFIDLAMVSNVDQLFAGVLGDDGDGKEQFANLERNNS